MQNGAVSPGMPIGDSRYVRAICMKKVMMIPTMVCILLLWKIVPNAMAVNAGLKP